MTRSDVPLSERPGLGGAVRRQWPWVTVVTLAGVGLILVAFGLWRPGLGLLGAAMVVGGLLRVVLKEPGLLAVRGKAIDVPIYFLLGFGLIVVDAVATVELV